MTLADLPRKLLTRCFSYLSTDLLTDIILLENIPDNILEAAADNLNLWYANKLRDIEENAIIKDHYKTSFDQYHDKISHDRYHFKTEFDRFVRIHKILEKKSIKRPLWLHYNWESIFEMRRNLDEINLAYNGQELSISADLRDMPSSIVRFFSDHDLNLKITCLSLWNCEPIPLNEFPKLETFYGGNCEIIVDHTHPSLKTMVLQNVPFSTLPVDLERLVARNCHITMEENHPKLEGLRVLDLHEIFPGGRSFLLQKLWNKDLETFSYTEGFDRKNDRRFVEVINAYEVISFLGPKVKNFGFSSSFFFEVPELLRSLYSKNMGDTSGKYISLYYWSDFTHLTSLTILLLPTRIDTLELPPNLLKLSIWCARFDDISTIRFPPGIVDLELSNCNIELTDGWLKPARLKRLSLTVIMLTSFKAFLPCCEYLSLEGNSSLKDFEIEAPVLEHINLSGTEITSIPKLPDSLQVLIMTKVDLTLSHEYELPSSLKVLDLSDSTVLILQDYTFTPSIEELNLGQIELLKMSGVKFAQGSRLKELILSKSLLSSMDEDYLTTIDDRMIELPPGLKALKLRGMDLQNIDGLTIPQSVTFLDLGENDLKLFKVKSHIETLYLDYNPIEDNFVVHEDLELRVLDLEGVGIRMFSFEMVKAEKLAQLRLGSEVEMIDLSKMPANFQILEHQDGGNCTLKEPNTGQSYIYGPLMTRISLRY